MSVIQDSLGSLAIGEPTSYRNLAMFPLVGAGDAPASYLVLDEALGLGGFQLTEISEEGSVPNLRAVNRLDRPVLLLDGEEVVGAKQNRVFNLSILVPAKSEIIIPVSCVEAGRWRHHSASFASAPRTQYAAGRASRVEQVSASLKGLAGARSNQREVWAEIEAKRQRLGVPSPTGAMADLYSRLESNVEQYVDAFAAMEGQVGAVFLLNGGVAGIDLFDSATTLRLLLPKLVRSYALDAIEARGEVLPPEMSAVRAALAALASCSPGEFPAAGMGTDIRLEGPNMHGAALVSDGRMIHLCAFPGQGPDSSG